MKCAETIEYSYLCFGFIVCFLRLLYLVQCFHDDKLDIVKDKGYFNKLMCRLFNKRQAKRML